VEKMNKEKTARPATERIINFTRIDLNTNDLIIVYRKYRRKKAITSFDERRKRNTRKKAIKETSKYLLKTISFLVTASNMCKSERKTSMEN